MRSYDLGAVGLSLLAALLLLPAFASANPLSEVDMADPCILRQRDLLYGYSTGRTREGGVYPVRISPANDRTSWTQVASVFTSETLPAWAAGRSGFWAPEVHRVQDRYVCYFSARSKEGRFCIGAGVASHPAGPFQPLSEPLESQPDHGLIDASFFQDPVTSRPFLLWKEDKNDLNPPQPTGILIREMEADGVTSKGEARVLIVNDSSWEGVLVEAPSIIYRDGYYYLFYTGNIFTADEYAVGVARSRDVLGPYEKYSANPILRSDERFGGPGHQFLFEDAPGEWTLFYHARDKRRTADQTWRLLMSDRVEWTKDGWPKIGDGTPGAGISNLE